ncbi:MAG: PGF-pre-PGF domain-containing protein, partial [Methanosarcina sp.]|nr:PGF-pre-PGF domain-containing protein [Methanosarcina sp.]
MRIKLVLFIIALIVSVQVVTASDIGVGVSLGNMSYRLAPGALAEQSLYVINTGTETATYNVFLDDSAYDSWFTFSASSFELRAGENKEVKVTLSVPASAEEDVDCKIKIPCTVPGGEVGTGVLIPVHIDISTSEESSSRVSSSGSSSSGGGGGSPEPGSNVKSKELSQQYVVSGSSVRFNFTQDATCVKYVEFDAKKSLGKITTVVEMLK